MITYSKELKDKIWKLAYAHRKTEVSLGYEMACKDIIELIDNG